MLFSKQTNKQIGIKLAGIVCITLSLSHCKKNDSKSKDSLINLLLLSALTAGESKNPKYPSNPTCLGTSYDLQKFIAPTDSTYANFEFSGITKNTAGDSISSSASRAFNGTFWSNFSSSTKFDTSADGATWINQYKGSALDSDNYNLNATSSVYLLLGRNISRSTDGKNWQAIFTHTGTKPVFYDAAFGNGIWISTGDFFTNQFSARAISSSDNGITWTSTGTVNGFSSIVIPRAITFGAGKFVIVGSSGGIATSTNGLIWTNNSITSTATNFTNITFGNGRYVAVGSKGYISYSTDGTTWISATTGLSSTTVLKYITFDTTNQKFIAGFELFSTTGVGIPESDRLRLMVSSDGITWTSTNVNIALTSLKCK